MLKWIETDYSIQPNYRTVRLCFSKLLEKLAVKYVSTYTKGTLKKRSVRDLSNDASVMILFSIFFSDFLYKSTFVGTHLYCINKHMPLPKSRQKVY